MAEAAKDEAEKATVNKEESMEVDEEPKEEDAEEGEADGVAEGGEGISRELYREMRAICETLTNHRIVIRGDE